MSRLPVASEHKVECGWCYGNGCGSCGNRGWTESAEGREEREDEEERRDDARRKGED
jgi:hypothetical protein